MNPASRSWLDGDRDLVLHYASHSIQRQHQDRARRCEGRHLRNVLDYKVYGRAGIIRKSAVLENRSRQAINVESMQVGVWYVPHGEGYRLSYLTGKWAGETQLTREPIHTGTKVIEQGPHQPQRESVVRD